MTVIWKFSTFNKTDISEPRHDIVKRHKRGKVNKNLSRLAF